MPIYISSDSERIRTAVACTPLIVKVLGALIFPGATTIATASGLEPGAAKVAPGPTVKMNGRVRYALTVAVRTSTSACQVPATARLPRTVKRVPAAVGVRLARSDGCPAG